MRELIIKIKELERSEYRDNFELDDMKMELIERNMPFIRSMLREKHLLNNEDAMMEAKLSLLKALDSFDLSKDVQFITYFYTRLNYDLNAFIAAERLITLPEKVLRDLKKYMAIEQQCSELPPAQESEKNEFSPKKIQELKNIISTVVISDIQSNSDGELIDTTEQYSFQNYDIECTIKNIFLCYKEEILNSILSKEERQVIKYLFEEELTLNQTALCMGISLSSVRRIQNKALDKLRSSDIVGLIKLAS